MNRKVEVFENEEASKLLDYFVAYKKLRSKVEYIKCVSALNSEVHFSQPPLPEYSNLNQALDNSPPIGPPATFEK